MLSDKYKQLFYVLATVLLLFFLQFLGLLQLNSLNKLANWWKEGNLRILQRLDDPFVRARELWNLTARLEDLQYRYAEAAVALGKVSTLEKENQELRKLLENSDRSYRQTIIAAPVVSFAQSFVGVGVKAGVKTGAMVVYKDTLLGLIDRVEEQQASVVLLPNLLDAGILVQTDASVKALLKGNGKDILLTEIPADARLEVGQLVTTISQVGIEKGLLIGRVSRVLTDNQALSTKTAVVEQLLNFYEVALVEIK